MDDAKLLSAVKYVLSELTKQGAVFTAFDVTRILRQNTDEEINHRTVRNKVHFLFDNMEMPTDYWRTKRMLSIGVGVSVFHPNSTPAENYDEQQWTNSDITIKSFTNELDCNSNTDETDNATTVEEIRDFEPDKQGRFCIPAKIIKEAGFNKGEKIWATIFASVNKIIIGRKPLRSQYKVQSYVVDKDYNIRLSNSVMDGAELTECPRLAIRVNYHIDGNHDVTVYPSII